MGQGIQEWTKKILLGTFSKTLTHISVGQKINREE